MSSHEKRIEQLCEAREFWEIRLKSMVESGQLTSRVVRLPDGYRCIAYRKKPNS